MIDHGEHSSVISATVEPTIGNSDASVRQMLRVMLEVKDVEMLVDGLILVNFVWPLSDRRFEIFARKLHNHARVIKRDSKELIR